MGHDSARDNRAAPVRVRRHGLRPAFAVRDGPAGEIGPGTVARPGEEVVGVSEGQSSARAPVGRPLLSLTLASMMDEVHAHSGAVYLLSPDQPVLEMAVMAGLPRAFAAPWERVGLNAPIPVSDAVRERRLVWVGGEEEMARNYPRIAMVLPYPSRWPRCRWRPRRGRTARSS
ncbi:hypothetical protein SHKM778_53010 [Streptomyces sp. KM77-8]|uniref:Uncharacterized protein n=1 Tax=Streptomyces haneummycinicus TaxID=3074435 RepID=A0AAT9HN14_9ACTN